MPKGNPSAWWKKLTPEQREMVYDFADAHTLDGTVAWIKSEFDIETSKTSLGDWLEKVRGEKTTEALFLERLEELRKADERSHEIGVSVGNTLQLHESNVVLLSQALQAAQIANDHQALKAAAVGLSMVMEAVAKSKKADADVLTAETQRDKFQFDAAKAALANAAELQAINAEKIDDSEKRARAIKVLFGDRPAHVRTAAEVIEP